MSRAPSSTSSASRNHRIHPLLCGRSEAIKRARSDIELFADDAEIPILLEGESGSGKTAFAEYAHAVSPRAAEPFVPVVLSEIEDTLINSELFGHEAGSFTGATGRRVGLLESDGRGTVFLDEIAKATPIAQARLLGVVEGRCFRRTGSNRPLKPDIRFILATNVPLKTQVEKGLFLPDLLERIKTFTVRVPPLRERREDIPDLFHFFLVQEATRRGYAATPAVHQEIVDRFLVAPWHGNIREFHQAMKLLVVAGRRASVLTPDHLHPTLEAMLGSVPKQRRKVTREEVQQSLVRNQNNRTETARDLGINRRTLYRSIARFDILDECGIYKCHTEAGVAPHVDPGAKECA